LSYQNIHILDERQFQILKSTIFSGYYKSLYFMLLKSRTMLSFTSEENPNLGFLSTLWFHDIDFLQKVHLSKLK